MKYLFLVTLMLISSISNSNEKSIFFGEWKSDKEKSLEYNTKHNKYSELELQLLDKILGKLSLVFNENQLTAKYNKQENTTPYTILSNTEKHIKININNKAITYYKENDWIYTDISNGSILTREYYRHVQ